MNVTELHPEDLLERHMRGELSVSEQERLDAHLAHCVVCRFERAVQEDFAADMWGERETTLTRAPRVTRNVRWVALLAAALTVSAAVAARLTNGSTPRPPDVAPTNAVIPIALTPTAASLAAATWTTASATPDDDSRRAPSRSALTHAVGAPPITASAATVADDVPSVAGATATFARANEARRSGDHARAIARYREVFDRYGTSPEASPARLALGRLLLDDGDSNAALALFDAYLRGSSQPLREEALLGRARCLEALHRDEERAAWSALVQAFPQTVHGAHAKQRIGELERR